MTGINRARIQQEDHNDSQLVSYKMANETEGGKRGEAWHPFTTRDPCASPVQLICVVYVDRASCVTTPDVEFIFILLPPPISNIQCLDCLRARSLQSPRISFRSLLQKLFQTIFKISLNYVLFETIYRTRNSSFRKILYDYERIIETSKIKQICKCKKGKKEIKRNRKNK